ncbi:MAG: hypothetical protein H6Q90_1798 [Deltaproteobacteria bacterium]|nr:hypothetical protein [Deltaproteobacteria bacterium]
MSFPWLDRTPARTDGADRRAAVAAAELAQRAALLYRLGFTVDVATKRLIDGIAWEYEAPSKTSAHQRPATLSDKAIAKIVTDTYARRP